MEERNGYKSLVQKPEGKSFYDLVVDGWLLLKEILIEQSCGHGLD
jgi:hypothetical protein